MILVLRALGIGDLCTAVPALRALRTAHPGEELVLAAPQWLAPLVALTGTVDRQVPVADLGAVRWPAMLDTPPRLAVNLHGRGPRSHRLLAAARPGRLWAFRCAEAGHRKGPMWTGQEPEHEVRRWCRLLRWYGVPADPADLSLPAPPPGAAAPGGVDTAAPGGVDTAAPDGVDAAAPDAVTVVHPGSKAAERRWPAECFAEVAAALAADGHRVVVTGAAAERGLVETVVRGAGLPDSAGLPGTVDVGRLAALVARARLVVCPDTGVGHLATGYGVPSVVVFGPTSPAVWGPPPADARHRVVRHHAGLGAVTVADVLAAARDALAEAEQPGATAPR